MCRKLTLLVYWAVATALLSAIPIFGQTTNGLITGVVTDPSEAVVTGAHIELLNTLTGVRRETATDSNGQYIVPQLPPGVYDISVSKQGFATVKRSAVQLEVNQNFTVDLRMAVSSVDQTVQVTGEASTVNTTSATRADVVSHTAIVDLPLNGRQFNQLTLLTPGAVPLAQGVQQGFFTVALGAGSVSPSVNGQRPQQDNYTMDGVLNNALFTNTFAISPPPDAVQEFNVQTHITDAQFAISSGANVNLVTRSGANHVDHRHPSPHIARLFWQETEGAHAPVGGELNRPKPQS